MDATTLAQLKKALEDEHNRLVGELKAIASRDPKLKGDWDSRFPNFEEGQFGSASHEALEAAEDEVEEYEVRLGAEHSLESRLLEVNHALERIKSGTYGICQTCKKEIPLERLRANPAAERHVEHS